MASNSRFSKSPSSSSIYVYLPPSWTPKQNKEFEVAIAIFDKDTPERWEKVASMVAGKTPEEVKRHYHLLLHDLKRIESGLIPIPDYNQAATTTTTPTNKYSTNHDDHK